MHSEGVYRCLGQHDDWVIARWVIFPRGHYMRERVLIGFTIVMKFSEHYEV